MRRLPAAAPLLVLAAGAAFAQDPAPTAPAAPSAAAQELRDLIARHPALPTPTITPDAERIAWIGRSWRHRSELDVQLVAFAERHRGDPAALDALLRVVNHVNTMPWPASLIGDDPGRTPAFALLHRDHLRSERLAELCQRISGGWCREYETFLRAVLADNPHREVQAHACLALARHLVATRAKIDSLPGHAAAEREFADLFGRDHLERLQLRDRAAETREALALFARAEREFGAVAFDERRTIAELAAAGSFELEHLQVGCEAPDIDCTDQHGERLRLHDHRGKVVLLDFWHWH